MVMEEQYMYLEYATCAFQTQVLWAQWKSDVSSFPMYILKFIATNKGDESDVMKLYSPDVRYYPGSNFIPEEFEITRPRDKPILLVACLFFHSPEPRQGFDAARDLVQLDRRSQPGDDRSALQPLVRPDLARDLNVHPPVPHGARDAVVESCQDGRLARRVHGGEQGLRIVTGPRLRVIRQRSREAGEVDPAERGAGVAHVRVADHSALAC